MASSQGRRPHRGNARSPTSYESPVREETAIASAHALTLACIKQGQLVLDPSIGAVEECDLLLQVELVEEVVPGGHAEERRGWAVPVREAHALLPDTGHLLLRAIGGVVAPGEHGATSPLASAGVDTCHKHAAAALSWCGAWRHDCHVALPPWH